ncbi:uncharacterized protein LOC131225865 isoform X1 [Magnolia sinica]|uniref:uncharacterized protein LOC131225865 isoform X1 n=1 Tax=Magnolia sinica TaxID=86752 RepID=UPI0026599657|nr:uncharacterized protein LOC131225865 isoform X1 [Magnolia sinica]
MMVLSMDCLKIHGIGIRLPTLFGTPGQSWDLTSNPFQYQPIPSNPTGQTGPKVLDASCTCLTSNEIHFKNIRFKSSTNRGPGSAALYSSKQYNLNAVPLTESAMLLSPLQGNFPGRNLGSLQEKGLHHT